MQRKKGRLFLGGLIIVLFLAWGSTRVNAQGGDLLSNFHPYIVGEETYDSNLFLTPHNPTNDWITSIAPGVRFLRYERNYGVDLDYRVPFYIYAKNSNNDFVGVNGTVNAWYTTDEKLTFRVRDVTTRSQGGREADYSATALQNQFLLSTIQGRRSIYFRNVFEPSVDYQFGRDNHLILNYRNNVYQMEHSNSNSQENYVGPRLVYWFDIRNGISGGYGLTLGNFQTGSAVTDLTGHAADVRYTYRFNPRTSIFADYTHMIRDFASSRSDYNVYRPTAGIEHAFSSTLSGRGQVGYFWKDPKVGSTTGGVFYDIRLTQLAERMTYSVGFQGGYMEDYFTAQNLGLVKYHRGLVNVNRRLLERLSAGLSGSVERVQYPADGHIAWITGVWGNASYQVLQWLTLGIEASCRQSHSTLDTANYVDYRGIFRVTVGYTGMNPGVNPGMNPGMNPVNNPSSRPY